MYQTMPHPAVLAPTPFASRHAAGHQPNVLHRSIGLREDTDHGGGSAVVLNDTPSGSRYRIETPKPEAAQFAYAASPGINESGGDELGLQFAETVTIRCE